MVYRDKNKDDKYNRIPEDITQGIYGINIHRSSPTGSSNLVNKWSAGCQVLQDVNDFNELMHIAHLALGKYGNSFTYTLLESKNIK
jgi:hypothetical protein